MSLIDHVRLLSQLEELVIVERAGGSVAADSNIENDHVSVKLHIHRPRSAVREARNHQRHGFHFRSTFPAAGKGRILLEEFCDRLHGFIVVSLDDRPFLLLGHRPSDTDALVWTRDKIESLLPVWTSGVLNQFGFSIRGKSIEQILQLFALDRPAKAQ